MTKKIKIEILCSSMPKIDDKIGSVQQLELPKECDKLVYFSQNSINDLMGEDIKDLVQRMNSISGKLLSSSEINSEELYKVVILPDSSSIFAFLEKGKRVEFFDDNRESVLKLNSDAFLYSEQSELGTKVRIFLDNYTLE